MNINISNANGEPIYLQIADQIKSMILEGKLREGEALPSMRVLATELRISFMTTKRAYEELERDGFIESYTGKGSFVKAQNLEVYREEQLRRIEARLPVIEEITGLYCSGWTVRDMHTRWGSCNTNTHHINLSLMLADRSDAELDYVILHELVHTVVPNHGPDFYALMDSFMPGWKKIRKTLNYG